MFYCHALFESFCYNCQHINVSYWHCTYKEFFKCTPTAKKICFIRQFHFRAEKVILFARNRLRALIVFICAHYMQIQVAHALCKQGCRLISYTADIRLVTIATCYNCPRSPLYLNYQDMLFDAKTTCIGEISTHYIQHSSDECISGTLF